MALAADQRTIPVVSGLLRDLGRTELLDGTILDFGCGSGRHVEEWRDAGRNAYGFDPHSSAAKDINHNRFLSSRDLPGLAGCFDVIFSTSVFEHVMDYDAALRQIAHLLSPAGVSVHFFPARWRPIESHMYVPLGGVIRARAWFELWAAAGIQAEPQRTMRRRDVARCNARYAREGINYLPAEKISRVASRHFREVAFAEDSYVRHTESKWCRRLRSTVGRGGIAQWLYRTFHTRALVLSSPIPRHWQDTEITSDPVPVTATEPEPATHLTALAPDVSVH